MFKVLRFLLFFAALVAVLVFLVLPAAVSPILTQYVRDLGIRADDLSVTVDSVDPSLLTGRVTRLRVEGTNVEIGRATVGRMDLVFGDVSIFDRSFGSVNGEFDDVVVAGGGISAEAARVNVLGPANNARVTGHFDDQQSEHMVMLAARRVGVTLDSARVVDGGLRLTVGGVEFGAGIAVEGGALVLRPAIGAPVLLLQPNTSDPWQLDEAYVSPAGITVRGTVDAERFAREMGAGSK